MHMAAEPLRLYAVDLDGASAPYRCSGLAILALSLASWTAILAAGTLLIGMLF